MILKPGERCRKLPAFSSINLVSVGIGKGKGKLYRAQYVSMSRMASFTREETEVPFGLWYFSVIDGHMHIYPYPKDTPLTITVRYTPPEKII